MKIDQKTYQGLKIGGIVGLVIVGLIIIAVFALRGPSSQTVNTEIPSESVFTMHAVNTVETTAYSNSNSANITGPFGSVVDLFGTTGFGVFLLVFVLVNMLIVFSIAKRVA